MSRAYQPSRNISKVLQTESLQQAGIKFGEKISTLKNDAQAVPVQRVKTIAKATKRELSAIKATWKSFLPDLSTEEVRRYRVPHHDVVALELEETHYDEAAKYLKMLFVMDEEMRTAAGPGTAIWTKPRLKSRKDLVERLKNGLAEANRAMLDKERVAQATALLETALYFQEMTWEWWWVAEQLFRSALTVSDGVKDDDSQTITIIRYLYGRFLLNEMKDVNGSVKLLEAAHEVAQSRSRWNMTKILGTKQDSLFRECCTLLYRAMVLVAKKAQGEDAGAAVEASQNALKHAIDSGYDEYITDATCELGQSYLCAHQAKLAIQNFVKYLSLSKKILNYDGICNAYMELAFAYKELGDASKCMEQLELFRETASKFQLPYKLAQAHYHIGEHLLSRSLLADATSHLEFAFALYNGMGQTVEAHQARCAAAISKGQEVLGQFIELVLRCGEYDETATLQLCDWKNNRTPCWRVQNSGTESYGENEEEAPSSEKSKSVQSYLSRTDYESPMQSELPESVTVDSSTNSTATIPSRYENDYESPHENHD